MFGSKFVVVIGLCALLLTGCAPTIPSGALELPPENLQQRQMETRRFDTGDEKKLLVAGAQVLQDLGFTIDESETSLGVITSSKDRDATESGQVAGAIALGILFGANAASWDDHQKIRASFVTHPDGKKDISARLTFQRVVWDQRGRISKNEVLNDPKLYQEFFDKLSQSVFLTANEI